MKPPVILRTLSELRTAVKSWKMAGQTVGVVPTMGALHPGHLSLVEAAKQDCERVIVTIFVNPKQFNTPKDLENYPRTEEDDARKLEPLGVDVIYVPDEDQMYPSGFATEVRVDGITACMDGVYRPGHFEGVATIVAKLFLQTGADRAYFGEKDYQQLQVVGRMARDLDIPIEVIGCPTVREEDGLAMSSRNLRLSPEERSKASELVRAMNYIASGLAAGNGLEVLRKQAETMLAAQGFGEVEYLDLRDAKDLGKLEHADRPARLFAAAWLGDIRLIDNIEIPIADQAAAD